MTHYFFVIFIPTCLQLSVSTQSYANCLDMSESTQVSGYALSISMTFIPTCLHMSVCMQINVSYGTQLLCNFYSHLPATERSRLPITQHPQPIRTWQIMYVHRTQRVDTVLPSCIPSVSTVPCGGQVESLWGKRGRAWSWLHPLQIFPGSVRRRRSRAVGSEQRATPATTISTVVCRWRLPHTWGQTLQPWHWCKPYCSW